MFIGSIIITIEFHLSSLILFSQTGCNIKLAGLGLLRIIWLLLYFWNSGDLLSGYWLFMSLDLRSGNLIRHCLVCLLRFMFWFFLSQNLFLWNLYFRLTFLFLLLIIKLSKFQSVFFYTNSWHVSFDLILWIRRWIRLGILMDGDWLNLFQWLRGEEVQCIASLLELLFDITWFWAYGCFDFKLGWSNVTNVWLWNLFFCWGFQIYCINWLRCSRGILFFQPL